ncbi:MAG: hypothetical protein HFE73_03985 [Firmicutes bacterium]|nr:hypothetical protein [Bacillota bacterium]
MRNKQHSSFAPPAIGGISLLVIFAVLCLTVFSLLSLSTVRADSKLSEASAQSIAGYYAADAEAEKILAQLRDGQAPDCVTINGDQYTYTCSISDTQQLAVTLQFDGAQFSVLRWQVESCRDVEIDDRLPVWGGPEAEIQAEQDELEVII